MLFYGSSGPVNSSVRRNKRGAKVSKGGGGCMKRTALWICIAVLTFSVGVACAFLWFLELNSSERQSSPSLSGASPVSQSEPIDLLYCHLMAAPDKYDDKVIRVQATYVVGIHGAQFGAKDCPRAGGPVWVSMSPEMWEELNREMERAYEARSVSGPLDVVFVGRFGRNRASGGSDTLQDTAPYRFDILQIERTWRHQ